MSDSGGGVKQFASEMKSTVGEVASDFQDAVSEIIEQGAQSIGAPVITSQQVQQKQQQDQKDLAETRRKLAFYEQVGQNQKAVIYQNKQKEQQRVEEVEQQMKTDQAKKGQLKQGSEPTEQLSEDIAVTRQEIGKGHGVGG